MATLLLGGDPPRAYEATQVIAVETADRGGFGGGDPIGHVYDLYRNVSRKSRRGHAGLVSNGVDDIGETHYANRSPPHQCDTSLCRRFECVVD